VPSARRLIQALGANMRWLIVVLITALMGCGTNHPRATGSIGELPWSSVHLEGMILERTFPDGGSQSLQFGEKGGLAITMCSSDGMCTAPLIVWKIENNRLKTGYAPTEGDALIQVTADKLVIRTPSGELITYSIFHKSGT
jgi:hypothetical protein